MFCLRNYSLGLEGWSSINQLAFLWAARRAVAFWPARCRAGADLIQHVEGRILRNKIDALERRKKKTRMIVRVWHSDSFLQSPDRCQFTGWL